jgi:hypothetical protein
MKPRRLKSLMVEAAGASKPLVPEAGRLVWSWFITLSNGRSYGFGPNPVSLTDIKAFADLNRWPIRADHIELIQAMDRAWLEKNAGNGKTPTVPRGRQKITIAAFDAMFG